MKKLLLRLKAPTPAFFRKVQAIGVAIAGVGITLIQMEPAAGIKEIAGHLQYVGAALVLFGQFAVKNAAALGLEDEPKKDEPKSEA